MIRFLALLVVLWSATAFAEVSGYFVRLTSDLQQQRAEMEVLFGKERLGPRVVTKYGTANYGPVPFAAPEQATVRWRIAQGPEQSMTVRLAEHVPPEFTGRDAIVFRLTSESAVGAFFAIKVDQFRSVEIPVGESPVDAKKRKLNEQLLAAAGRGNLDAVKQAVADGADPGYLSDSIYPSPVRLAANGGHFAVVDFLLGAGAKLTKRDLSAPYLAEKAKALGLDVR